MRTASSVALGRFSPLTCADRSSMPSTHILCSRTYTRTLVPTLGRVCVSTSSRVAPTGGAPRVPTAAAAAPPPSPPPSVPCRRRRGPLATLTARAAVAAASSSGVQPSRADGDRRRAARRRRPCRRAQRHHLRRAQGAASERRRRWEMAHVVRLSFGWSACRAQGRRAGVRRGPDQGGDAPGPGAPPRGTPPARRFSGVIGQRRDSLVDAGRWLGLSLASSTSVVGRLL